jgi:hypothetical protein
MKARDGSSPIGASGRFRETQSFLNFGKARVTPAFNPKVFDEGLNLLALRHFGLCHQFNRRRRNCTATRAPWL